MCIYFLYNSCNVLPTANYSVFIVFCNIYCLTFCTLNIFCPSSFDELEIRPECSFHLAVDFFVDIIEIYILLH